MPSGKLKVDWDALPDMCSHCDREQIPVIIEDSGLYQTDYTQKEYDDLERKIIKEMRVCSDCKEAVEIAYSED